MARVTSLWMTALGIDRTALTTCCVVVPSSWVTETVSLTVLVVPGLTSLTVRVRYSVRCGWCVSCVNGGRGMLSAASRLASMVRAWTASPVATGSRKKVSPSGTKDTLVTEPPPATVIVPAISVTSASITAVTVSSWCPADVGSSTISSMAVTHSDSTVPSIVPGDQPRDVILRSHSSPSMAGSG